MNHKILKSVLAVCLAVLVFSGLSCDDRKASNIVEEEGLTLTFIKSQPVANRATVGEAIVGYAGVYLIVELRNADGQPVKMVLYLSVLRLMIKIMEALMPTFLAQTLMAEPL